GSLLMMLGALCAGALTLQQSKAPPPEPAVGVWAELLTSDKGRVRLQAAAALGELGPRARAAVPILTATFKKDQDCHVRRAAAVALGQIGPAAEAAVLPLVEALLDEQDYDLATDAAGRSGRSAPRPSAPSPR